MKIWHDDVRPAPDGWSWARTNDCAQELLESGQCEEISLDHDLGYHDIVIPDDPDEAIAVLQLRGVSEITGLQLVDWMIENDLVPPKVTIHSWNPDGANAMARRLNECGHNCIVAPFVIHREGQPS